MSFQRARDGSIVPLGRFEKRLYEPFVPGGAFPAWLAAQAGTASYLAPSSNSPSGAVIATSGANNAGARLWTTFDMSLAVTAYKEIIWTLHGLRFSQDDGYDIWMQISRTANDAGVSLMESNGNTLGSAGGGGSLIRAHSGATPTDHPTAATIKGASGGSRKPRSLSMRFRPEEEEIGIFEGDQMMGYADVTGEFARTSSARCMLTLTAREATAISFTFTAAELILRHN